jgi:hypothetical protein
MRYNYFDLSAYHTYMTILTDGKFHPLEAISTVTKGLDAPVGRADTSA